MNPSGERSADSRLGAALILLLILAAFGQGGTEPGVLLAWHLLLGVLLLLVMLAPGSLGGGGFALGPAGWLVGLPWVGVVLVGAWFAPYAFAAWLFVLELGAFLAMVALSARAGPELKRRLVTPLLLLAAAEGLYALVQRTLLGEFRPAGTFLNPNHLAGWIVVVLLLVAGEILHDRRPAPMRLLWRTLAALPALAALGVIASRGALLGLAAGAMVLIWFNRGRLTGRARAAGALVILILVVASGFALWKRLQEPDPFRYTRLQIWRSSAQALVDAPWTGTGPRQFAAASRNLQFPDDDGPLLFDRSFSFPHSDWLRAPCELGWPGALALLCGACGIGVCLRRRVGEDGGVGGGAGALAALAAIVTQASVDHMTQRPAIYLLGAALLGSLLAEPSSERHEIPRSSRLAAAVFLALVLIVGDVGPYLAWRNADGIPAEGSLDPGEISRLERAVELNALHPDYPMRLAAEQVDDGAGFGIEDYAMAREAAEHAVRLQPMEARYRRGLAKIEAQACRFLFRDVASRDRARLRYLEAESRARYDPFLPLELAMFLSDVGDPAGARRAAERALSLEPESVLPRLVLADSLIAEDRPGAARRAEALVAEAQALAERWASWAERSEYAKELLTLDSVALERVRRRLGPSKSPAEPGEGGR